jgi:hypothetical protein
MRIALLLALLCTALHTRAQRVTNVTAEQQGQELLIHYHLEADGPVEVQLYLSTDRGSRWEGPLKSCTGDVGLNVAPGTGKRIRWEVLKDRELVGDGIAFKVVAKGGVRKDWLNPAHAYSKSGYALGLDLSYGIGFGQSRLEYNNSLYGFPSQYEYDYTDEYMRFSLTNGSWVANGKLLLGIGLGVEYYPLSKLGLVPVYADIRIIPITGRNSPMIILQPGYSFGVIDLLGKTDLPNGFDFTAGIGLHSLISVDKGFEISMLYDYQNLIYRFEDLKISQRYGTARLTLGFIF